MSATPDHANSGSAAPAAAFVRAPLPRDTLSRPLRDLRISVIDRCNFRCPYCMPRERYPEHYHFLKSSERLTHEELMRLVRPFVSLGVSKLRLTGGEPLLRAGLADLVSDLGAVPGVDDIALTTNGVLLPQHAAELRAAGLRRITVSLDSLDNDVFRRMAGDLGSVDEVLAGIAAAGRAGLAPIKINVVVQRGINDHTVLPLLEHFRGTGIIVRLIEYMDVGNRNDWQAAQVVSARELLQQISARWPLAPLKANYRGEVARRYRYEDGAGEIGFIASISQPFCGECSRARLSSDGVLFGCLFASKGLDLRAPLRAGASEAELAELIRQFWLQRNDRYSELRESGDRHGEQRVEMYHVGG